MTLLVRCVPAWTKRSRYWRKTITVEEVGQRLLDAQLLPTPPHERGRDSSVLAGLITVHRENERGSMPDGAPWIRNPRTLRLTAADVIDTEC